MTQQEIIEMAKESNLLGVIDSFHYETNIWVEEATTFAKLVAAKEREACAEMSENLAKGWKENPGQDDSGYIALSNAARFIRARGEV
jgi:hypothetical protein